MSTNRKVSLSAAYRRLAVSFAILCLFSLHALGQTAPASPGTGTLRGSMTFVLSSSGHIQSIVNPPGNPKAKYFLNTDLSLTADKWIESATAHPGSWWDHWLRWYDARGDGKRRAPAHLGSVAHPAGDPAPGRYVHQH